MLRRPSPELLGDAEQRIAGHHSGSISITAADKTKIHGDGNWALTGSIVGIKNLMRSRPATAPQLMQRPVSAATASCRQRWMLHLGQAAQLLGDAEQRIAGHHQAPLITAADAERSGGDGNPAPTGSIVGIKNSDAITASYSTTADATTGVGSYSIVPAAVDASPAKLLNYSVTLNNGSLGITRLRFRSLAADKATKIHGDGNPAPTSIASSKK